MRILFAMMLLSASFMAFAQDEEAAAEEKPIITDIARPNDVKLPNFDGWKNSVFDLYEKMMGIKAQAEADPSFDAAENVRPSTGELILLAGKSILMVREAKQAPALKKVKSIPAARNCVRALNMCKRYAKSVLGDEIDLEEDEEESEDGK